MKPKSIFLVRHGQSKGNVDCNLYDQMPDWKIELTHIGVQQAIEAGRAIHEITNGAELGVYVSPYIRTRQTLQWMNVNSLFAKEDPRLREQEAGLVRTTEDRSWGEIEKEREFHGSFFYRFHRGESGADVYDRCTGFLDTLYRDFEKEDFPENVLIVTHGFTLRVLVMRWLHLTVEDFQSMRNPLNCQRFELRLREGPKPKYQLAEPFPRK